MSALPRRSTHTMIGVTLRSAPRTMAILRIESVTSVGSNGIVVLRAPGRWLALFGKRALNAAENLVVAERLSLRRIGGEDLLRAILQIDERAVFLRVNGRRQHDVGNVVQRMRGIPRMNDEELRFAQIGDDRGIFGAL